MIAMVLTASLAFLAFLAIRYGADSREGERTGWIVERPRPVRGGARAGAARARISTRSARRTREALQAR